MTDIWSHHNAVFANHEIDLGHSTAILHRIALLPSTLYKGVAHTDIVIRI